jgi:hypothetical protein
MAIAFSVFADEAIEIKRIHEQLTISGKPFDASGRSADPS